LFCAAAHPRPVTEGIPFLGFQVFPERRRLKHCKGVHFQRRLHALLAAWREDKIPVETLVASIRGWCNHVRYGNTVGLRKAILRRLPTEIVELLNFY
jgi:RNA-directed DNA polymerase